VLDAAPGNIVPAGGCEINSTFIGAGVDVLAGAFGVTVVVAGAGLFPALGIGIVLASASLFAKAGLFAGAFGIVVGAGTDVFAGSPGTGIVFPGASVVTRGVLVSVACFSTLSRIFAMSF